MSTICRASLLLQGFGSNPQVAWMATNVAVAVAAQVFAGVVLYWSLGGGWARKMAWLGVIPLTAALNVAYLSAIPAVFLIEADTAAEINPWTEHCFVRGAELRPIRTPVTQASPSPRAWWAALPPDGRDTLLRVPDCPLTDAVLPKVGQSPEGYLDYAWPAARAFRRRRTLKYANTSTPRASAIHVIGTVSFRYEVGMGHYTPIDTVDWADALAKGCLVFCRRRWSTGGRLPSLHRQSRRSLQ